MINEAKTKIAKAYGLVSQKSNSQYIGFDSRFTADARIDEKMSRKSTATNFYVEDGSPASDHIIVDPLILSISGEVSKVTYQRSYLLQEYLEARQLLGSISVYLPNRTNSQISKIGKTVNKISNVIRKAEDITDKIKSIGAYGEDNLGIEGLNQYTDIDTLTNVKRVKNLETDFIAFLEDYVTNRKLMKVETAKYGILENMAIVNYSLTTNNEDNSISYTIDLQEIRTVKTIITPVKQIAKNPKGQAGAQTQDKADKGVVQGQEKSLAFDLVEFGKSLF